MRNGIYDILNAFSIKDFNFNPAIQMFFQSLQAKFPNTFSVLHFTFPLYKSSSSSVAGSKITLGLGIKIVLQPCSCIFNNSVKVDVYTNFLKHFTVLCFVQ